MNTQSERQLPQRGKVSYSHRNRNRNMISELLNILREMVHLPPRTKCVHGGERMGKIFGLKIQLNIHKRQRSG